MKKKINFEDLPEAIGKLLDGVEAIQAIIESANNEAFQEKILSIEEASEFLKVQKQTLYKYVSQGWIPYSKRAGRLYFSQSELIQWIKEGRKQSFDQEIEAKSIILKRNKKGANHEK